MVTTSIVSIKFFTYLFMGSAHTSDIPMYCLGIVSAYIGLNIGNALAKRMNQQARTPLYFPKSSRVGECWVNAKRTV